MQYWEMILTKILIIVHGIVIHITHFFQKKKNIIEIVHQSKRTTAFKNINQLSRCPTSTEHCVNPLSPHDALKHHFTSLKTELIFL